jgi:hypothetical protein
MHVPATTSFFGWLIFYTSFEPHAITLQVKISPAPEIVHVTSPNILLIVSGPRARSARLVICRSIRSSKLIGRLPYSKFPFGSSSRVSLNQSEH